MAYQYDDSPRADILRMIPRDGKIIGSIGCGYAATETLLVKEGRIVHGVDIAKEVEPIARERLASFARIEPGAMIPWEKESLDGLILADVLEHIPAAWNALRTFAEFVRPGGWVAISVPNMQSWEVWNKFMFHGDWQEKEQGIFDATHVQMMSRRRLLRWCEAAGLEPERFFDQYDPQGPRRRRFFCCVDWLTLRLVHNWWMYQIQGVFRKRANGATPGAGGAVRS
jgi:SAM-dependent methyltransferase